MQMNPTGKMRGRRGAAFSGVSSGFQRSRRDSKYRQGNFKEVSSGESYDDNDDDDDSQMILVDKKSNDYDEDLNTIRNDKERNGSRIERKKSGQTNNRNINGVDHIVDSYEIYGEDNNEDESEDDYVDVSKKRQGSN